MNVVNYPVLKAFVIDLATTVVTLALTWLTLPDNLTNAGLTSFAVPIVAALAGAGLVAWRRFAITKKEQA